MLQKSRSDALAPPPKEILESVLGTTSLSVEWLAGDGSDRCYYRIHDGTEKTKVLMQLSSTDAQALAQNRYDWLDISSILLAHGIATPIAFHVIKDHAAIVIEDYGDVMLETKIKNLSFDEMSPLYHKAMDINAKMLLIDHDGPWKNKSFDADKYRWELRFFYKHYLQLALGIRLDSQDLSKFLYEVDSLADYLAGFSRYFCHRDFHSRNIMMTPTDDIALIDFQDARYGSCYYDLVSLVFDNYVDLTFKERQQLLELGVSKIHSALKLEHDHLHLETIMLQRQLKAIGTYGYLTLTKKRGDYLKYVPIALATLPELNEWPFLSGIIPEIIRDHLKGEPQ
jgi:N-acetylmuramate 1-kinase